MRWMVIVSLAPLVCLAASNASAGRIFGDIMMDGRPVPAGLQVKIAVAPPASGRGAKAKAAPRVAASTVTDRFGSYKLTVKDEGKCILTLVYGKQAPTLQVFSYRDATRYDLTLEKRGGKVSLRRK